MQELKNLFSEIKESFETAFPAEDLVHKKKDLEEMDKKTLAPGFWDNHDLAQKISQETAHLREEIENWEQMKVDIEDIGMLLEELKEESPEFSEVKSMVSNLEKRWKKLRTSLYLHGKYDKESAILSLHCGTGGKDAQDFTEMLLKMYVRWCEHREYKVELIDRTNTDDAGIKGATLSVKGPYAYGYLRAERGVHRLVRLSPFNSGNTRETSFAMVQVLPDLHEPEIEIDDGDLKIDVFRSSGAGGQSVNTTDSAVRITHIPTGVTVTCQNERSQLKNKEQAMKVLHARLIDMMHTEQIEKLEELKGKRVEMSWGNQMRSYVLHPYKMVKDHRTGHEENNVDAVLDGHIDSFIETYLSSDLNKK